MATYEEDLTFEASKGSPGVIRLVRIGNFYRAYNRSAWLFVSAISDYKVMRKHLKRLKQDLFYIGFPASALFSNIGKRESVKTDRGFDIMLSPDEIPPDDGYDTWCATVETAPSSAADFLSLQLSGAEAEREAIRQLREFPLESKSMLECVTFLAQLRQLLKNK